jgi:hypothetical protein
MKITSLYKGVKTPKGGVKGKALRGDSVHGPKDSVHGPKDRVSGPKDTLSGPIDTVSGPKDSVIGPIDSVIGPIDSVIGPIDSVIGPIDTLSGPKDSVSGPIDTLSGPIDTLVSTSKTTLKRKLSLSQPAKRQKSDSVQTPAYKRFAHLTPSKLPSSYDKLYRQFVALENVLDFLQSRGQDAIYHKIVASVQAQSLLDFGLDYLARILYLYPSAYILDIVQITLGGKRLYSHLIRLPDKPSLSSDAALLKIDSANVLSAVIQKSDTVKSRRLEFQRLLTELVTKAHLDFLSKSCLAHTGPGWHPLFDLESLPPIPKASLPPLPVCDHVHKLKADAGILPNNLIFNQNTTGSQHETAISNTSSNATALPNANSITTAISNTSSNATALEPPNLDNPNFQTPLNNTGKPISRAKAMLERVPKPNAD